MYYEHERQFKIENNLKFGFKTYHEYTQVKDTWQEFLPKDHALKDFQYSLYEAGTEIVPFYINVYNDGLVGVIYGQLNKISIRQVGSRWLDVFMLGKKYFKLLIVGNSFSTTEDTFFLKDGVDGSSVFNELPKALKKIENEPDGIIIKDVTEGLHLPSSYNIYKQDFVMEMQTNPTWNTLEDYTVLLSKKYRKRSAKIRNQKIGLKESFLSLEDTEKHQLALNELFQQVAKRQITQVGKTNENYLKSFISQKNNHILGYFLEDKVVGFAAYSENKNSLEINLVGFDTAINQKHALYLNMLFDGLEYTIEKKLQKLKLGRTALTAKVSLGAYQHFNKHYFYFKNRVLHNLFTFFLNKLYRKFEMEERNPFKAE